MEYCEYEGNEEESHYSTPVLKARATATAGYTQTTHSIPAPVAKPVKRSNSFLFSAGVGMCIVVALLFIWNMVIAPFIHSLDLQWHYGDTRVYELTGEDVGHGGISRFIAFSADNEIVVGEVVNKQYSVYIIPTATVQNKLVTLSLRDVNGDGKPDLIVQVDGEEGSFVLYNTGTSFQWSKP